MSNSNLCAHTLELASSSRPPTASHPSVQKLIGYQIRQSFADSINCPSKWDDPSPMQDARWLSLSVELSKMHLLAKIMCQSKGQSSVAILIYGTYGAFPLHGKAWYGFGTVHFLGGFPLGTLPGTWYFFSTTSTEVPSEPYRYQNMTCKLCWSPIGRRESSLLRQWTCDMRPINPLDLYQHSQRRSGHSFCWTNAPFCINHKIAVSLSVEEVQTSSRDSRGADPVRAWWCDAEGKSFMYIHLNLLYFQSMSSVYIFTFVCVLLQLKTIWSNKCTSRLY